jgi:class 3 adenylate cyclase
LSLVTLHVVGVPETRYAKSGDVHIAYQVFGEGPFDLVLVPGFVSNVEHYWEMPVVAVMFQRLASFSRLILWDKRGTGLSDPVAGVPSLDERMDDLRAVLDTVGSDRAALFGVSEGGPMSLLFAATYPQRTRALALYGTTPRFSAAPDFPFGWSSEAYRDRLEVVERNWGAAALIEFFAPSVAEDEQARAAWSRYQRAGASPGMARAVLQALAELDVRPILGSVRVPTLIVHRRDELVATVHGARLMAETIPDAKLVELPGQDHLPFVGDWEVVIDEVEEFLTGARPARVTERVLATVLFTDIVASTERAAALGDYQWRRLLDQHDELSAAEIERHRGKLIKTTGDGLLATFDGPARAVQCAAAIRDRLRPLGVSLRAGVHTGEVEVRGEDVGGIAVHIGSRVAALAAPDEVMVSRTVTDLVAGSGLSFEDRGSHVLKGLPQDWQLFALIAGT